MATASSRSCSSRAAVGYRTEQAVSIVMDTLLPNVVAADSDSGSVSDFLC